MNRSQALKELELLENYEFDRADAPGRLLSHLDSEDSEVLVAALRASTGYFGLPGIWERAFDLALHAQDELRRASAVRAVAVLPLAAIVQIRAA